jgi:exopolyphosphatase/guanosine-5'-triphosphate,3'-diphosphate pyrophosphatase
MDEIPPFPGNSQVKEAWRWMRQVEPDQAHALHVFHLTRELVNSAPDLHQFSGPQAYLLECAALLHDIGWAKTPDGSAHHKHSCAMIMAHPFTTLDAGEVTLVAQIARYHRKKMPTLDHPPFAALSPESRTFVSRAAAFLRLADALDRSHRQIILSAALVPAAQGFLLNITTDESPREESAAVRKKSDLFLQEFGGPLQLAVRQPAILKTTRPAGNSLA